MIIQKCRLWLMIIFLLCRLQFGVETILGYEMISLSGWRNFTALLNFENVKAGNVFTERLMIVISGRMVVVMELIPVVKFRHCNRFCNQAPKTVFTAFYGSWFGDWNTENNFLRSALASNGWILTSCWSGRPHYVFHQMGMGETIGSCIQRTQNN